MLDVLSGASSLALKKNSYRFFAKGGTSHPICLDIQKDGPLYPFYSATVPAGRWRDAFCQLHRPVERDGVQEPLSCSKAGALPEDVSKDQGK